jgi:hypothetical protein
MQDFIASDTEKIETGLQNREVVGAALCLSKDGVWVKIPGM